MENEEKDLLLAVSKMDSQTIVNLAAKSKAKKCLFSFNTVIKNMREDEIDKFWDALNEMVIERIDTIVTNKNVTLKSPTKKVYLGVGHFLQAVIDLALAVFEQSLPAPKGLLHIVVLLNSKMFDISNTLTNVKNNIAFLCEKMYHLNYLYQDSELITLNTLLYLFKRSEKTKATKKDIKRIYALRSKIPQLISSSDMDTNDVWNTFKKCVTCSSYLSILEGQKIIAHILTADRDHLLDIHEAIKKRLPSCSLSQGAAYGRAYLEAWSYTTKADSTDLKDAIEIMCLCDLIVFGIKGRQKSLVMAVRKLLGQFNIQKKDPNVSKMLHDAYQPILWRFLKSHDGLIRANAAQLFLDVFPLEDPNVKIVETDMELNEQMLLIKDLLVDDFPIVRSAAVIGLCIAMSVNWELFPEDMLKTYFKIIVNDLSCDSSSSDVRCAVVKGFKVLLENPLTISTMQLILPKLSSLFHDISDTVRIAFVQLLLRVKRISAIKYFEIVPLAHILARMEEDTVVAKSLVNLIHNSYFPRNENPDSWLARCVEMIKADRGASRVFFQHVSSFIGLESTAKFMIQTVKAMHFYVKSKMMSKAICVKQNPSPHSATFSLIGSVEALEKTVGFHDIKVVSGLLDGVAILWLSCLTSLEKPENKNILKMIVAKLAKYLDDLSLFYKDTPAWQSVYYLCSFMPPRAMGSLPSLCFYRVKALEKDAGPEKYEVLIECLTNQDEIPQLFGLMREWIKAGFDTPEIFLDAPKTPAPKRRKKSNTKENNISSDPKPMLSINMLNSLLNHKSCQKVILAKHPLQLKEFLSFIEQIKKRVESLQKKKVPFEEATFLTEMFYFLLKCAVLLHVEESINAVEFVEGVLSWVQNSLLKHITSKSVIQKSSKQKSATFEFITLKFCKDLVEVMTDMTLLGFINVKTLKFLKFATKLLNHSFGAQMLMHVSKLLLRHTSFGIYYDLKEKDSLHEVDILRILPDCFSKVVQCLNVDEFIKNIPSAEIKEIQFSLAGSLLLIQPHPHLKELISTITLTITKHILSSVFRDLVAWSDIEKKCGPFEQISISKSGTFLLATMCMKPKLVLYFLQHLQKYLIKSGKDIQTWVACFVIIVHIYEIKNQSKNLEKEMNSLVTKMETLLCDYHPLQAGLSSKVSSPSNSMDIDSTSEDNDEISFGEHCHIEYKKLKDKLKLSRKAPTKAKNSAVS